MDRRVTLQDIYNGLMFYMWHILKYMFLHTDRDIYGDVTLELWDSYTHLPVKAALYTNSIRCDFLCVCVGIPTLIFLDMDGHMITRQGRVEVLNDPECHLFPWHPRPVLELSESNAVQLHEGPCLVLFVGE